MKKKDHGPIEADLDALMNSLASAIDEIFNAPGKPKAVAFVLLTARFGDIKDGRVNYISNGHRPDMIAMMKEMLARTEGHYAHDDGHA